MTRWELHTAPEFDKKIRALDRQTALRIKSYLEQACCLDDPRNRGKGMTGEYSGYWRYRVGPYRVIARIEDTQLIVIAIGVGHRSTVYR